MNTNAKKILQIVSLSIFFLLILVYAFFRSQDLIFGIQIKNVNIADGQTFTESVLKINGNAKNAVNISLNGREISVDQDGNWEETIALLVGYNMISIRAEDKFGGIDEKNYKVMYTK